MINFNRPGSLHFGAIRIIPKGKMDAAREYAQNPANNARVFSAAWSHRPPVGISCLATGADQQYFLDNRENNYAMTTKMLGAPEWDGKAIAE